VTRAGEHWPGKGIHYRMHPENVGCLLAAGIDCCVLANNHVLDFGRAGLVETLEVLAAAGISTCGAGRGAGEALAPAGIDLGDAGRVVVYGFGAQSSGIPAEWAAGGGRPGVNLLPQRPGAAADAVLSAVAAQTGRGDLVVVSIHWGGNFGYEIPREQRELAHRLVDSGAVDVVHGHSSHHARGVEIYRGKPIFYGCGDFINDYEGIAGHEQYRGDLAVAWFVEWDRRSRSVAAIDAVPLRSRALRLRMAADADVEWLRGTLERECAPLGVRVERAQHDRLRLTGDGATH
jgi:poly-gamma-glutamate synthesis protein (capsule biosynthesis protein)